MSGEHQRYQEPNELLNAQKGVVSINQMRLDYDIPPASKTAPLLPSDQLQILRPFRTAVVLMRVHWILLLRDFVYAQSLPS